MSNSTIVNFQGDRFDFGTEKQLKQFITLPQNTAPNVFKKIQSVFGQRFDNLDSDSLRREGKLDYLIRLTEKP